VGCSRGHGSRVGTLTNYTGIGAAREEGWRNMTQVFKQNQRRQWDTNRIHYRREGWRVLTGGEGLTGDLLWDRVYPWSGIQGGLSIVNVKEGWQKRGDHGGRETDTGELSRHILLTQIGKSPIMDTGVQPSVTFWDFQRRQ